MKKLSIDLKNALTSSITTEVETSQLMNSSTPSKHWVLKVKPNKSWTSFNLHPRLKIWILAASLKSSDSTGMAAVNLQLVNFSNTLILTSKELLVLNNSRRLPKVSDRTSQLLKLTKWSTMLIKTEMERSTTMNSSTLLPKNTLKYEKV